MKNQRDDTARRRTLLIVVPLATALAVGGAWIYGSTRNNVSDAPPVPTTSAAQTASGAEPTPDDPSGEPAPEPGTATPAEPSPSRTTTPPPQTPGPVSTDEAGERSAVEGIAFDEPAELSEQVEVEVVQIEEVDGEVTIPGEVARPALRFTIRVTNEGSSDVNTVYQAVNAYYGSDNTPAAPFLQPGGTPLPGSVSAESSITGVYLFDIPVSERGEVVLEVDINPRLPVARFSGDAG